MKMGKIMSISKVKKVSNFSPYKLDTQFPAKAAFYLQIDIISQYT